MIRKLLHKFLGTALVAAAAAAAPAHAGVITFDGGYPGPVASGDTLDEAGYSVAFYSPFLDGDGSLVGYVIDGDVASCDVQSMLCPPNASGAYYAAVNDSYLDLMFTKGPGFQIRSFDASFIGGESSPGSYPSTPGTIRVLGFTAGGGSLTQDFVLDGPTSSGFRLAHFDATGTFANTTFVEALVYGLACDKTGTCTPFDSDKGQFAIDNLSLTDVPEPATAAIVGLGLLGLTAARRRKS